MISSFKIYVKQLLDEFNITKLRKTSQFSENWHSFLQEIKETVNLLTQEQLLPATT